MNLKTKALGLVAGSLIAISLTTGVMAQDAQAVLADNASGDCSVSVEAGKFDMGTFIWNGSAYTGGNEGSLELTVDQTMSSQNQNCHLTISGGTLTQTLDSDGQSVSDGASVQAAVFVNNKVGSDIVSTSPNTTSATATVSIAPGTTLPAGTYTGTVTVAASKTAAE